MATLNYRLQLQLGAPKTGQLANILTACADAGGTTRSLGALTWVEDTDAAGTANTGVYHATAVLDTTWSYPLSLKYTVTGLVGVAASTQITAMDILAVTAGLNGGLPTVNASNQVAGVSGNVVGAVGSVATGGIAAASFAAGAIDNAAIATDAIGAAEISGAAVTKMQTGLALSTQVDSLETGVMVSSYATGQDPGTLLNSRFIALGNAIIAIADLLPENFSLMLIDGDGKVTPIILTLPDIDIPSLAPGDVFFTFKLDSTNAEMFSSGDGPLLIHVVATKGIAIVPNRYFDVEIALLENKSDVPTWLEASWTSDDNATIDIYADPENLLIPSNSTRYVLTRVKNKDGLVMETGNAGLITMR